MLTEQECVRGLVVHLDPERLIAEGGTYTCSDARRVRGGHFFLCLSAADSRGSWLPLYSNNGPGREALPTRGRVGHPKWTQGTFYRHGGQLWEASNRAIVDAAETGNDLTAPGNRNTLSEESIPRIRP